MPVFCVSVAVSVLCCLHSVFVCVLRYGLRLSVVCSLCCLFLCPLIWVSVGLVLRFYGMCMCVLCGLSCGEWNVMYSVCVCVCPVVESLCSVTCELFLYSCTSGVCCVWYCK